MNVDDVRLDAALRVLALPPDPGLQQRLALAAASPSAARPRRAGVAVGVALAAAAVVVLVLVATWRAGPTFRSCGPTCVELSSGTREPLQLQVGAVALRVDGEVRLDFGSGSVPAVRSEPMTRDQLASFLAAHAAVPMFTIAVLGGSAVVEAQQRLDLRAGQVQQVAQPTPAPPPSPADLAAVRTLWPAVAVLSDAAAERCAELVFRLRLQPALYDVVRADLQRLVAEPDLGDEVFARAVQLLVFDPAPDSYALAARLVGGPRALDPDALLRLSERGLLDARRALVRAIDGGEAEDGEWFAIAAHLAANAKPPAPRLQQVLTAAYEHENGLEPAVLTRAMVAALGLQALGDEAPLRALWRDLAVAVDAALAGEAIEDAAAMVAIADWLRTHGVHGTSGSLAYLRDDFLAQFAQREAERTLTDAARIRERLAAILPK
ncbi:MAG: hypothetical protein JNL08_08625 [Planctomycetes bacterium]|nr:hypothetical protein [Planctomycetota bacterium]